MYGGLFMRVITGTAKGITLLSPDGDDKVRPTTDRVKEALFSIINFDIEGATVCDLFAGSGQLGIEALSRGAASCVFCDCDRISVNLIKENLKKCRLLENSRVECTKHDVFLKNHTAEFDIIFIDPPYSLGIFNSAAALAMGKIRKNGLIIVEHPTDFALENLNGFLRKDYKYGKIAVTVYRKSE